MPYKIEFKYKDGYDKVHLNNSDTINGILADIQQKDASGNSINVLYVFRQRSAKINESKEPDGMIDREAKESDESKDKKPRLLIESGSFTSSIVSSVAKELFRIELVSSPKSNKKMLANHPSLMAMAK